MALSPFIGSTHNQKFNFVFVEKTITPPAKYDLFIIASSCLGANLCRVDNLDYDLWSKEHLDGVLFFRFCFGTRVSESSHEWKYMTGNCNAPADSLFVWKLYSE